VSLLESATQGRLASLQRFYLAHGVVDPAGAMYRAVIAVGDAIHVQAPPMGYPDSFGLLGAVLVRATLAVALPRKGCAAADDAH
jgi:MFS transporter, DHA2 family, multidrug resistance protein